MIIAIIVIVAVIVILAIIIVGIYNSFIKLKNKIEEAYSGMDVFMKKRYDLIPNLVSTVKGYAAHESSTLTNVVQARSMCQSAKTMDEKAQSENFLQGTLKSLFAVSEAYPQLKADTQFLNLQKQLAEIEEDISRSRRFYNAIVKDFNTKCESFPTNLIAKKFKFEKRPMFEINSAERENVKVQF